MTDLEDRIRTVLRSQAKAMDVPPAEPGDRLVTLGRVGEPRRRWRVLAAAAVTVTVLAGGLALLARSPREPDGASAPDAPALRFETPTVLLEAWSLDVVTPSGESTPGPDVEVNGDPGTWHRYTTLELEWHDGAIPQRAFLSFESDGTTWWASEIRTYDGSVGGEWVEPAATGRFFETPIGMPFEGNLDLPNLRIDGVHLEVFRRPAACDSAAGPIALIADYPVIEVALATETELESSGFGATFQAFDTASCEPLPVADLEFEFVIDDPAVATVDDPSELEVAGEARRKRYVSISFQGSGETTLHATARDRGGALVGTVVVPIVVSVGG